MARTQKSYFSNDKLVKNLDSFREAMGAPALSNFFKVEMDFAPSPGEPKDFFPVNLDLSSASTYQEEKNANNLSQWFTTCGLIDPVTGVERYNILANEAMLPGTSMSVAQEIGSRQGIRERFATQRSYTDISISFYLSDDYKVLRLFQEWMNFINPLYVTQEGVRHTQGYEGGYPNHGERYAFHRQRYPYEYKRNIQITKFERDFKQPIKEEFTLGPTRPSVYNKPGELASVSVPFAPRFRGKIYKDMGPEFNEEYKPNAISYNFVNAFPISIQDIPLNYQSASIMQVTVDFCYDRYYIVNNKGTPAPDVPSKGKTTTVNSDNAIEPNMFKPAN